MQMTDYTSNSDLLDLTLYTLYAMPRVGLFAQARNATVGCQATHVARAPSGRPDHPQGHG